MARRTYATVDEVKSLMPNQISAKLEPVVDPEVIQRPVTETNIEEYLLLATEEIDAYINAMYQVPLRRIKTLAQGGTFETNYPEPISTCCALIAASMIYAKLFSENANPDSLPKYSEQYRARASKYLDAIMSGENILRGQIQLGKRYVRGESRDAPRTPWDKKNIDNG